LDVIFKSSDEEAAHVGAQRRQQGAAGPSKASLNIFGPYRGQIRSTNDGTAKSFSSVLAVHLPEAVRV